MSADVKKTRALRLPSISFLNELIAILFVSFFAPSVRH